MTFTKDNQSLSLTLDKGDPSGLEVTLALSSSSTQTAETPVSQTPVTTQGSQPTVNPSESSLPSDIPSYPGSTELANQRVPAIMLQTADSADKVAQFYSQQMAANNWALLSNTTTGGVINQGWEKDTRMAMITIHPAGGITKITIAVENQ
jgi:cell division septation protein DedD